MATRTTVKPSQSITLVRGDAKVHSVIYLGVTDGGSRFSIYVPNDVAKALGNPAKLTVELTAA